MIEKNLISMYKKNSRRGYVPINLDLTDIIDTIILSASKYRKVLDLDLDLPSTKLRLSFLKLIYFSKKYFKDNRGK